MLLSKSSFITQVYIFFTEKIWRGSLLFWHHVILMSLKEAQHHLGLSVSRKPQSAGESQDNLQCLTEKEAVGHPLCCLCNEPAVIRLVFLNTKLIPWWAFLQ